MNHFKALLHTLNYDLRQLRRVVWSIVLNTPNRSSKANVVGSSHDSERRISVLICSSAVSVERPLLYTDCLGLSRLFLLV